MRFEFATATRIIFGAGTIHEVAPTVASLAGSAIVITGGRHQRANPLLEQLDTAGIKYTSFSVPAEPTTTIVEECIKQAMQAKSSFVISIGGGSVMDTGKAVAAMLTNSGRLTDYLEVVGSGKPLIKQAARHIAIPTTAGTGAEVTRNAVLTVPDHQVKVSMRSPLMLPWLAVVDPQLTYSLPPAVTASTGLDAITQLMEAYVCSKANPMTDSLCREGLSRAARSLMAAYMDGNNISAREDMSLASLFGGLALANAGLGAVHGLAGPLGGLLQAPHGVICGRLLPHIMQANLKALKSRSNDSPALARYDEAAKILLANPDSRAVDALDWVNNLCNKLEIPPLSEFGLKQEDLPNIAANAANSSSMKGNPIVLTHEELINALKKAL
jgi:alcohol dehydrogenase class IV